MKNLTILFTSIIVLTIFGCSNESAVSVLAPEKFTVAKSEEKLNQTKAELIAWKDTIYTKLDNMEKQENAVLNLLSTTKVPADKTIQMNIANAALHELVTKRNNMKQLYAVDMELLAVDEKRFADFKAQVAKGAFSDEAIQKELTYYNVHFNTYQSAIVTWKSVLRELEINSNGNTKTLENIIAGN